MSTASPTPESVLPFWWTTHVARAWLALNCSAHERAIFDGTGFLPLTPDCQMASSALVSKFAPSAVSGGTVTVKSSHSSSRVSLVKLATLTVPDKPLGASCDGAGVAVRALAISAAALSARSLAQTTHVTAPPKGKTTKKTMSARSTPEKTLIPLLGVGGC